MLLGFWSGASLPLRDSLFDVEVRGVEQDLIPYVGSWYLLMFLLRDGSFILRNKATLMLL